MTELILLIISFLLIAACGLFVAAEFSLITVNRTKVERLAAAGDHGAKGIAHALKTLSTQLSGAQVGITITNLAIGFLAEPAIARLIEPLLDQLGIPDSAISAIAIVIGISLATVLTMVFGELIPKNLAIARPLATARYVQRPQRIFSHVMKYPIKLLNGSANVLLRKMGVSPQEELSSARSADELSSLVRRSAEQGMLPKETAMMLERTLVFDELTALDVMTPRIRMHSLRATASASAVLELTKNTGHSRFPVTGKNPDDIVGIIHVKHVFGVTPEKRATTPVSTIMKRPVVVPSSIPLDALLNTLKQGGLQMAVVIDEFGGTDGLVTMEDVVEELVDEVRDEHDQRSSIIRRRSGRGWTVSGLLRPDEISESIGISLPEDDDFETVGGLVADRLERIPQEGDYIEVPAINRKGRTIRIRLEVERMEGWRVDRLHMEILPPTPPKGTTP